MKKKFYNRFLMVAMLLATVGSYVSCKDYDEEAYADVLGKNSQLEKHVNEQVNVLEKQIDVLEEAKDGIAGNLETIEKDYATKIELNAHIDEYKKLLDDFTNLDGDFDTHVENFNTLDGEFDKHLIDYAAYIAKHQTTDEELNKKISDIEDAIIAAKEALQNNLNDSIVKVWTALNGHISSSNDYMKKLDDHLKSSKETIDNLISDNKSMNDRLSNIESEIKDKVGKEELTAVLTEELNKIKELIKCDELEKRVKANEEAIISINNKINTELIPLINGVKTELTGEISKVNTLAQKSYDLAKDDSIRIDNLDKAYSELKTSLGNMKPCDNSELIARIDSICGKLKEAADTARIAYNLAEKNLAEAKAYTDQEINKVIETLRGNTNITLEELEKAYKKADEELEKRLQDQIDALKKDIEDVTKRVKNNEEAIAKLTGKLEQVDKALQQFISGIILQRAENPVFGSYAFPANIQTNVLMAYYGYAGSWGAEFPTDLGRFYVRESETLSQKDLEMLGYSQPVELAKDGEALVSSAGKVYVTVNPSNIDFEDETLSIVNSLDEESGIKLSPLKYSDKKLTFGSTRAAVNGFYEAEAILDPKDINKVKMTFDLNVGEFKETVKDLINPLDGVNVSQVANTMFDVMSQFNQRLDANALKASWTDTLGVSRNTYSQYNLATTAIRPLSYAFMADANFTSFPGFDKMRNVVGSLKDKMAGQFEIAINKLPAFNLNIDSISHIDFKDINLGLDSSKVYLSITYNDIISIPIDIKEYIKYDIKDSVVINDTIIKVPVHADVTNKDDNNEVIGSIDFIQDVKIPGETIKIHLQDSILFEYKDTVEYKIDTKLDIKNQDLQSLFNDIGLGDIDQALGDTEEKVNDIIDRINTYLDELGDLTKYKKEIVEIGNDVSDKLKDKIISYLNKLEDKLLTAVNSINKALQPVMLVNTTSGFQMLSQTIYNPTVMTAGNVQFIPTSYTAEIVAPAYKKLVGVTNVYSMDRSKSAQNNDASCLSALKEANAKTGIADILDGNILAVNFSAKKGYIYEVTYTSVDFSGMVVAKKYYVTVK